MAKPEKAGKVAKPTTAIKSKKTKQNSPPAQVQLSSEFVKDSSDEDDDAPAPPVNAKETALKKKEPLAKKKDAVVKKKESVVKKKEALVKKKGALVKNNLKAPEKKVKPKSAVVDVSSEDESSSGESDDSEDRDSESSKNNKNIAKAIAKTPSASGSESETEKEKEDSSDDDSDSSSGISIAAPTNKYVANYGRRMDHANIDIEEKAQPLTLARAQRQRPLLTFPRLVLHQPSNLLIASSRPPLPLPKQQTCFHHKLQPSNRYGTSQRPLMCPSRL